jgi:hypothetical protein
VDGICNVGCLYNSGNAKSKCEVWAIHVERR